MLASVRAAGSCLASPGGLAGSRRPQSQQSQLPLLQHQAGHNKRRLLALATASSAASAPAVSQALLDQERRERETEARRRAFAAQREAEIAAERKGLAWWEADCPPNMRGAATFDELRAAVERAPEDQLVVVNFFAPECYACRSLQPKLRQLAAQHPHVAFVKVNGLGGDDLRAYVEAMQIDKIPYFHFYKANARVAEFTANMRPERLALLRAELAAHGGNGDSGSGSGAP